MDQEDLSSLLRESRDWNQDHDLTGMLLYVQGRFVNDIEGRFIQVLEGTEGEVKGIFEKIQKDSRHYNVTVLNEAKVKMRSFKSWTMGFEHIGLEQYRSLEGSFDLNETFLDHKYSSGFNVPLSFLRSFYSMSLGK